MASNDVAVHHNGHGVRRRSVGSVEVETRDGGRQILDTSHLDAADRELAEKYGYKPVSVGDILYAASRG